jgi:DNA-binding response OmpR family regulator
VVDDDRRLLSSLELGLTMAGFEVVTADSAGNALPSIEENFPDVIVLDVSMPGMDGLSFCRVIRRQSNCPVLMLTARDEVQDRVAGLEAGADDYLVKPFSLDELIARLQALIRRAAGIVTNESSFIFRELQLDRRTWRVRLSGRLLELTPTEFLILDRLMSDPERVFTRGELLQAAWGDDVAIESNTVDVHISNIRKKLEVLGGEAYIRTVRKAGYSLMSG